MTAKKALIITELPLNAVGGIEKVNLQLKELLESLSFQVEVIDYRQIVDQLPANTLLSKNSFFTRLEVTDYWLDWKNYDLVISNNLVGSGIAATPDTKVITLVHGVLGEGIKSIPVEDRPLELKDLTEIQSMESRAYQQKTQLIAVSEQVSQELASLYRLSSVVVRNSTELSRFKSINSDQKPSLKEHYGLPLNQKTALYCGRWSPLEKRPDIILEVALESPSIHWVFATDVEPEAIEAVIGELIPSHITILNNVSFEKIHHLYGVCDFCIQTSLYEGFSNFALESLACGLPMISTPVGMINSLYKGNDLEGLLIEQSHQAPKVTQSLKNAIDDLLARFDFYQNSVNALRPKIEEKFSNKVWLETMTSIINSTTESNAVSSEKVLSQDLEFKIYQSEYSDHLKALFLKSFDYEISPDLWEWKMMTMQGFGMCCFKNDEMIAFYGGLPRSFHYREKILPFLQVRDVMVDPKMRGILRRRGPFALTTEKFLDHFVSEDGKIVSAFGFPNDRHLRVGNLSGLYEPHDKVYEHCWQAKRQISFQRINPLTLAQFQTDKTQSSYESSAEAMYQELDSFLVAHRDSAYLIKRYFEHPTYDYKVLECVSLFSKNTYCVLKELDNKTLEIMDIIGSPSEFRSTLKAVSNLAFKNGYKKLTGWFSQSAIDFIGSESRQEQVCGVPKPMRHGIKWDSDMDRHMWLTAGDTDFK